MKKIVLVVLSMAFSFGISQAQVDKSFYQKSYDSRNNGTFDKSTMLLSFGLGAPTFHPGRFNASPAFYGKFEHGLIRDEVGLGGYISTGWGSYKYAGDRDKFNAFSLGVLGYYHFNKLIPLEKMDVYAGAGLAFRRFAYNYDDSNFGADYTDSGVIFVVKVGIRYYVVNNFAVYAESGWDDMSSVNFGGTFRF
ncbi:hypothetical protein [Chryseolinea sp. H1M3-3]|uniref:outer membrane protein n=1 Tax=Chryseolinea sp. H1M3-3 TaxID=3034144 RepID=UPI0023EE24D0|nr:hypothetical protein [Chryseolinea sp. H1M3-3]